MLNKEELTKIKPILGPKGDAKKGRGGTVVWAQTRLIQRSVQKKQCVVHRSNLTKTKESAEWKPLCRISSWGGQFS